MTNFIVNNFATVRYEKNTIFTPFFDTNTIFDIKHTSIENLKKFGIVIDHETVSVFKVDVGSEGNLAIEKYDENMTAEEACLTDKVSVTEPLYILPNENPAEGVFPYPANIVPVADREYLQKVIEQKRAEQEEFAKRFA
jgi:hypothetical protein